MQPEIMEICLKFLLAWEKFQSANGHSSEKFVSALYVSD